MRELLLIAVLLGAGSASADTFQQARASLASSIQASQTAVQIEVENIVNADSVSAQPGGNPYQNKLVIIESDVDPVSGAPIVKTKVSPDQTAYVLKHDPAHPGADPVTGIVKMSNVRRPIAQANVNEATLQTAAATQMVENVNKIQKSVIDLLRSS